MPINGYANATPRRRKYDVRVSTVTIIALAINLSAEIYPVYGTSVLYALDGNTMN